MDPRNDRMRQRYEEIAGWFERLQPGTLDSIGDVYAPDAAFTDPFNDVRGVQAVRQVYEHMFASLVAPAFKVSDIVVEGDQAFMTWSFDFRLGTKPYSVVGCTHFRLDAAGRIVLHRDYWDAAREVYEHVPLLGAVLRTLRRRLKAAP